MAAALLAALAIGFSTTPPDSGVSYALRWSAVPSGLIDGLGFAVEPDFCAKVMPQFEDRRYIACSYLQSAILRAFETWSSNHPDISFVNVTEVCANDRDVVDCMEDANRTIDRGNCTKLCSAAQVFVLAEGLVDSFNRTHTLPARVEHFQSIGLTSSEAVEPGQFGGSPPLTTSGVYATRDGTIGKATLTINLDQCLYLDSTFCFGMHEIEANGIRVYILFALIMMPVFACALVGLGVRCCLSINALRRKDHSGIDNCYESCHVVTTPIWLTWLLLAAGIICPYVYFSIAAPCVRCFDFEATFAHYVGRVLGLSAPNVDGVANYELTKPINSSTCVADVLYPPAHRNSMLRSVNFTSSPLGEGPLMRTPSRTRVERCPSLDDLQGLNYLYPPCSLTRQDDPVCVRSFANFGLMRFASVVVVGIIVAFLVVSCCSWCSGAGLRGLRAREAAEAAPPEEPEAEPEPSEEKAADTAYPPVDLMAAATKAAIERASQEESNESAGAAASAAAARAAGRDPAPAPAAAPAAAAAAAAAPAPAAEVMDVASRASMHRI